LAEVVTVKCSHEIKKIVVQNELSLVEISVLFTLSDFKKLKEFKLSLSKFSNEIEGQRELFG
jgi:hypothetical protein